MEVRLALRAEARAVGAPAWVAAVQARPLFAEKPCGQEGGGGGYLGSSSSPGGTLLITSEKEVTQFYKRAKVVTKFISKLAD